MIQCAKYKKKKRMKVLYNVTVKIDEAVHQEWLSWMKNKHVPDVMRTGCFESYRITRILGDDNEHGVTFAMQYVARDISAFDTYQKEFAKALQQDHAETFKDRYAAFRTLMQIEEEGK